MLFVVGVLKGSAVAASPSSATCPILRREDNTLDNVHRHGITQQEQHQLLAAIGHYMREFVREYVQGALDAAVQPLLERIEQLESSGIRWRGPYERALVYQKGDVCLHDSAWYIALTTIEPTEQPGKTTKWQLAKKTPRVPTASRTHTSNSASGTRSNT